MFSWQLFLEVLRWCVWLVFYRKLVLYLMLNKKVSKSVSTIVLLESASVLSLQAQKGNGPLSHSPVPKITENIITKGNETIFEKNSSSVVFLKFLTYMFIFVCVYGLCCRIERCLVLKSCDRYIDQYKNTRREKRKLVKV